MTKHASVAVVKTWILMMAICLLGGCGGGPSAVNSTEVYHYISKSGTQPAKNLQLEMNADGTLNATGLAGGGTAHTEIDLNTGEAKSYFDGHGSTNIKIVIREDVGRTDFAGLTWRDEVVLNIWTDGVVEVDRA